MRVPLKWLARYVELDRDADELAKLLNGSGNEVARIDRVGSQWQGLRVAEILTVEKHPNADRLQLATVNTGSETLRVVCGAPNIAAGQKVPFAPVGASIQGHILEARPIRGIPSEGMLCASDEIGLSPDHSGILRLDPSVVPGTSLEHVLGDDVLELEVTPNRSDCLGMIGIAREVAALTGRQLRLPSMKLEEMGEPIERLFKLRIDDYDLCPRFVARLITGLSVAQSPWWMQSLLHLAGIRSINNVVDVTNFIMLEWSKPLHAYDFDKLRGREIIVRRATPEERLTTLDAVDRQLAADMLVIADAEGPIGLAGVMGGEDSEIKDSTTSILLESADFNAVNMRRTARALGMHSEAVRRFERGTDPDISGVAADHASYWFAQLAGGQVAAGAIDLDRHDHARRTIAFSGEETGRLLGKRYSDEHISRLLRSLDFDVSQAGTDITVQVPSWRLDVKESADLVEEVARITGYDDLPVTMPSGDIPTVDAQDPTWTARMALEDRLRAVLRGAGFTETVSHSLISEGANGDMVVGIEDLFEPPGLLTALLVEPLKLANAMTEEHQYLRVDLLPSLLRTYADNRRHESEGLKFFEIGRAYWQRLSDLPEERKVLGLLAAGPWSPRSWHGGQRQTDFNDLRGALQAVFDEAGVEAQIEPAEHPSLHPGRTARFESGGRLLGFAGEVHPLVREKLGLPDDPIQLAELDLEALIAAGGEGRRYRGIRRFPAVTRQLSIALSASVPAEKVRELILRAGGDLLIDLLLADVFDLGDGRRSLSYAFTLQSDERTLTDGEANQVRDRIMAALGSELDAVQR